MERVMRRELRAICFIGILLLFCAAASGQIESISLDMALGYGMSGSFDAATGTQTLIGLNGAVIYSDDPYAEPWYFSSGSSNINGTFTGGVGNTSGTEAEAHFSGGTWHFTLNNAGSPVFDIEGTVDWYWELEDALFPNKINGQGKVTFNQSTLFIDDAFFGGHGIWNSADGKSAITTSISNILPVPLDNYDSDWTSSNVSMVLWADSSKAVPEPATLVLLGLGSLLLRKRK